MAYKRKEYLKVLSVFQEVSSKFLYKPMSPRTILEVKETLLNTQAQMYQMDRNPIWKTPFDVVVTSPGTFEIKLLIMEDLIID